LAVLASGNGSNLGAIIETFPGAVVGVFCNRPQAYALERARRAGIEACCCPRPGGHSREAYDANLALQVRACRPDLVVLAGWMHILGPAFLTDLPVINLHPAWLPEDPSQDTVELPDGSWCPVFRGAHALEDALERGVSYVGSSVHWVTQEVDRGRLILREARPVLPGDTIETLRSRLLPMEHRLLPAAIRKVLGVPDGKCGAGR
jgi:folate-dependent phosphoribosylglycinamide formyltransferase PurN